MASATIELQEVLHISEVMALKEQLVSAIDSADELVIDAASVERADSASIQLLLAAKQTCMEKQATFSLNNISEPLKTNIKSLGLLTAFEIN